jgi:hypothetical protein
MIQILPYDLTEMRRRSVMLVTHLSSFVEEHSLRALAVHLAKSGVNINWQTSRENVRTNQLATNDTTPHVYGKAMLVVAFDSSMRILTIPEMGISCIVDSIAGKMGFVGEQMLRIIWELELIQRHNSNRLHMSAGSRY